MAQWNSYGRDDNDHWRSGDYRRYVESEQGHPLDNVVLDPTATSDLSSLVNIVGKETGLMKKVDILEALQSSGLVKVGSVSFKASPFEEHVCVYLTKKGRDKVEALKQK